MISDIQIKDAIYSHIKGSDLVGNVSGILTKTIRPKGSNKEDICISVLANQNSEIQSAFVNVNIYVQDIFVNGQYEENSSRLRTLCTIVGDVLKVGFGNGYRFTIDSQRVLEVDGQNEHLINTKLLFKNLNEE